MTSGQVASMVRKLRRAADSWTVGATPCAEKTTIAPSGTSSFSCDEDRAELFQPAYDMQVVNDLAAHVDGRP